MALGLASGSRVVSTFPTGLAWIGFQQMAECVKIVWSYWQNMKTKGVRNGTYMKRSHPIKGDVFAKSSIKMGSKEQKRHDQQYSSINHIFDIL